MNEHVDAVGIFKSLASPSRVAILKNLEKHPMNYSELMRVTGIEKRTGSGKFAHHLRILLSSGLVRVNEESKLYELTPKGIRVIKILSEIRSSLAESQNVKVRRSNLVLEDFDRNRISKVLIEEAGMPPKTADKVAKAVEERLENLRIDVLTSSLIREFVNAFLLEHGLEEYRSRLIRLGIPVADVDKLIQQNAANSSFNRLTNRVASEVFKEYVVNKILPREAAEKYFAGEIDFEGLETWAFSVYCRAYGGDDVKSLLREVEGIEFEAVVKDPSLGEMDFSLAAECIYEKGKSLAFYFSEPREIVSPPFKNFHILIPYEKNLQSSAKEIELVLSGKPASSEGHPFEKSAAISGKASVNVLRLFMESSTSEKKFWDSLRNSFETLYSVFGQKSKYVERFWKLGEHRYIVSLVGVEQLIAKAGFSRSEILQTAAKECHRISDEHQMLLASRSSPKAAERLKKLDINFHGAKEVERFAENHPYSWNVHLKKASEVREVLKFFDGGLSVKLSVKEAESLIDLKPLVVSSF